MSLRCPRFTAAFLLPASFLACSPDRKTPAVDTAVAPPAPVSPAVIPAGNTGWEDSVSGPALLLAHPENPRLAAVVIPSLTDSGVAHIPPAVIDSLAGLAFDLVDRTGSAGSSRLLSRTSSQPAEGCVSWPLATFEDTVTKSWRIGLQRGVAKPLPLDSLEAATSADSISVTTELARLASALPASNDSAFQGLPFAVRKAYRTRLGQTSLLIGDIIRKINEEANPRAEHLLLIAERGASGVYSTVFHSRSAGPEEAVRTNDVLAVVRFAKGTRATIVVAFEYENGSRVALIERLRGATWKLTWSSAYTGC